LNCEIPIYLVENVIKNWTNEDYFENDDEE